MMKKIRAGFATKCITPPLGTQMMGYATRVDGAKGVFDDLHIRALALEMDETRALILAFDVSNFGVAEIAAIQAQVRSRTGIGADALFINTSHTHAGPIVTTRPNQSMSPDYMDMLFSAAAEAAAAAFAQTEPADLFVAAAPLHIGGNRRKPKADGSMSMGLNPGGQTLPEVTVWQLVFADDRSVVVFSAPFHGTTLGGDNRYISAEWMGIAVREIERRVPGAVAMFLQGCAGDQNPHRDRHDYEQVVDNGTDAAQAVVKAIAQKQAANAQPLKSCFLEVGVPVADGRKWPVGISGLRLGDAVLVGLAGEAFVEYAHHVRKQAQGARAMCLGYTNGAVGYLCTARTLAEGGYEASANKWFAVGAPWTPEIEVKLKEGMDEVLEALAGTGSTRCQ